jgi:hypothetical protein
MIRKTMIALSIALVFESVSPGVRAFAYTGSGGGAFGTFPRDRPAGGAHIADHGYRGDRNRVSSLHRNRAYRYQDVWGHWGDYYGPLVHGPL